MSLKDISYPQNSADMQIALAEPADTFMMVEDGQIVSNGKHFIVSTDDYRTRRQATYKVRPSTFDAKTNRYSKRKNSAVIVHPIVDALTGKVEFATLRIEMEVPPAFNGVTDLMAQGAWVLNATQTEDFWKHGNPA